MAGKKLDAYPPALMRLVAEKNAALCRAQAFSEKGLSEPATQLWAAAGAQVERLAPLLDGLGREGDAAEHRISAAGCYQRAGDLSRAANLYRAALNGPLREDVRQEVTQALRICLAHLTVSILGASARA